MGHVALPGDSGSALDLNVEHVHGVALEVHFVEGGEGQIRLAVKPRRWNSFVAGGQLDTVLIACYTYRPMAGYTFISSRDPVDGDHSVHQVAVDLAETGHDVALFLVENGTFLARKKICADLREQLAGAGVKLLADDFALSERGIVDEALADEVDATALEVLVDHLAEGRKVTWH